MTYANDEEKGDEMIIVYDLLEKIYQQIYVNFNSHVIVYVRKDMLTTISIKCELVLVNRRC